TASWVTERELRTGALGDGLVGALGTWLTPATGTGWPDGVLVVTTPDGSQARAAVEVERHAKAPRLYAPKLAWYRRLLAARALDRVCWYCATLFLDAIDRRAAETIIEHVQASTAFMPVAQLRVLGGAVARVPADATAFAHRERRIMATLTAVFMKPDEPPVHQQWVTGFAAALRRDTSSAPGAYVNFLADAGAARVREAYPGSTWDRLRAIKARYDPTNLFRLNQNIPPATNGDRTPRPP
ncbi:MAG: BBE domain-containing protein, partial [Chloroflexota bacterium]